MFWKSINIYFTFEDRRTQELTQNIYGTPEAVVSLKVIGDSSKNEDDGALWYILILQHRQKELPQTLFISFQSCYRLTFASHVVIHSIFSFNLRSSNLHRNYFPIISSRCYYLDKVVNVVYGQSNINNRKSFLLYLPLLYSSSKVKESTCITWG